MSAEDTKKVVSRAVLDEEYRKTLYSDPSQALQGYDLTPEEVNALRAIPAETIDDFANNLEERISLSLVYFGAEAMGGNAYDNKAMGNKAYGADAMGAQAMGNKAYGADAMGAQAMGNKAYGADAMGAQAMGSQAYDADAMGGQAMSAEAMGAQAFGGGVEGGQTLSWFQRLAAVLGLGKSGGGSGSSYY